MASSRPSSQVVHQDYIARVRFDNSLPPPSLPPKLLDIPGTGLAGGEYTSAAYASKLAKEQPLNIEADAELGMPIDLVGIPGVFDGDERAIMARPGPQKLDPADKELLKPLSALGKGAGAAGSVSFLRRTEYTSSQGPQQFSSSKDLLRLRNDQKRRRTSTNKEDPINIIRNVVKGFDIAYPKDAYKGEENTASIRGAAITEAEAKAWSNPKHPSNPDLELLDSYPVLPDLDALPSTACFLVTKFITNPVASSNTYDTRLDAAILRQKNDEKAYARWNERNEEWKQSGSTKPQPIPEDDYEYFLPVENSAVRPIKRKLNVNDPENQDETLYTEDGPENQRVFKYARLRTYETYQQTGDPANFYDVSVALALHDPETEVGVVPGTEQRLQKGAYYYPIMQRTALRPKRNVGPTAFNPVMDDERIDEINLTVGDVDDDTRAVILEKRATMDPSIRTDAAPAVEAAA